MPRAYMKYLAEHGLKSECGVCPARLTGLSFSGGLPIRGDYPADTIRRLANWFERNYEVGMHGDPCGGGGFQTKLRGRGQFGSLLIPFGSPVFAKLVRLL